MSELKLGPSAYVADALSDALVLGVCFVELTYNVEDIAEDTSISTQTEDTPKQQL